ncbi:hypothetical protein GTP58_24565 [Duganella sp. CY15W]|uniref:hypothetical protein n=1 Tax=Duganella sp. CY15W TaxID=2692172 RepID=UPI00136B3783|nr:hypothetical protein [Duganella sp. CY15W]MYM31511.1 hypothetical protein [Duganella sp. CY15W]
MGFDLNPPPMTKTLISAALAIAALSLTLWFKYDDWFVYRSARLSLSSLMKDPSSAQFRNERFIDYDWYCGEINAKNGMGAYTGYKRFISGRLSKVIYLEGTGMIGKESTDEFILVLAKKVDYLESFNAKKGLAPEIALLSESEQYEQARVAVFEDHWKKICN